MPQVLFDFTTPAPDYSPEVYTSFVGNSDRIGVYTDGDFKDAPTRQNSWLLRLKRLNPLSIAIPLDDYSRCGLFFQEYCTVNFSAAEVSELLGFLELRAEPFPTVPDGRAIDYQLSLDGESTWVFWDGAAWSAAGGTDWNTWDEVDLNLPTLPYVGSLHIKIRLTPSTDGKYTPKLAGLAVYLEYRTNYLEDLGSSLADYLRTAGIKLYDEQSLAAASTIVLVTDHGISTANLAAYNLTDDPAKLVNVVGSLNPATKTVTFTAPQTGVVRVEYDGILSVSLGESDICPDTEQPRPGAIIIFEGSPGGELNQAGAQCFADEVAYAQTAGLGYLRVAPKLMSTPVTVNVQAYDARSVSILQNAVEEILAPEAYFDSYGTAQKFDVFTYTPIDNVDNIGESLHIRTFRVTLVGKRWLGSYATHNLVEQVKIMHGTFREPYEEQTLDEATP